MQRISVLHPVDVAVALSLLETPNATFQQLADLLGISTSTAHAAVERLRRAGLVRIDSTQVVRPALLEFLEHGVRYAFPATIGADSRGVPTAHAGPALSTAILADSPLVWPADDGAVVGPSIVPLFKQAPELSRRSPRVYWLLTLVDALRVGRVRERALAIELLRTAMYGSTARVV